MQTSLENSGKEQPQQDSQPQTQMGGLTPGKQGPLPTRLPLPPHVDRMWSGVGEGVGNSLDCHELCAQLLFQRTH